MKRLKKTPVSANYDDVVYAQFGREAGEEILVSLGWSHFRRRTGVHFA
jgi:hypothetical protein